MNDRIIPFTYRRLADKKRAFPLFFTFIFASAIFVVLSMTVKKYAGVISLVAVGLLTATCMIYLRYIVSDYIYSVTEGTDGQAFLIFSKVTGKKQSMMGNIPLYSITSIQKFTNEALKTYKSDKKYRKYNFAPSFNPEAVYIIKANNGGQHFEIVIEGTDEFSARLIEYSNIAKEEKRQNEE